MVRLPARGAPELAEAAARTRTAHQRPRLKVQRWEPDVGVGGIIVRLPARVQELTVEGMARGRRAGWTHGVLHIES